MFIVSIHGLRDWYSRCSRGRSRGTSSNCV